MKKTHGFLILGSLVCLTLNLNSYAMDRSGSKSVSAVTNPGGVTSTTIVPNSECKNPVSGVSALEESHTAELNQTGVALSQYYTRDYSKAPEGAYSDHAPVIYGDVLVWNVGQQGTTS